MVDIFREKWLQISKYCEIIYSPFEKGDHTMKLATTTGDLDRICKTEEEKVFELHRAGFRYIDMSFYQANNKDSFLMADDWREHMKRLRYFADSLGISFVQSHAPGGNPMKKDDNFDLLIESTIRTIEACSILGIDNTVFHTGVEKGIGKDEYYKKNLEALELLFPTMEKYGVKLLIENSAKVNAGGEYFFYTGEDMREFCEYTKNPLVGACWDTGHANIENHQYEDLIALGDRLCAIHFNDNRGTLDEHIAPFLGTMAIDDVMHGLIDSGYSGCFTLECDSTLRSGNYWLGNRRRSSHDDRLYDPNSLNIFRKHEELLYETAKYILEAYDLFEG